MTATEDDFWPYSLTSCYNSFARSSSVLECGLLESCLLMVLRVLPSRRRFFFFFSFFLFFFFFLKAHRNFLAIFGRSPLTHRRISGDHRPGLARLPLDFQTATPLDLSRPCRRSLSLSPWRATPMAIAHTVNPAHRPPPLPHLQQQPQLPVRHC